MLIENHFSPHLVDEFRDLCVQYAAIVRSAGINIAPFESPDVPIFSTRPPATQAASVRSMRADLEILQSIRREGFSLRDSAHHLWRYLSSIKATPDGELFDKISSTDLVEMYSLDDSRYAQVFRNLRVLECVSFTLEQMFGMDWRFGLKRKPEDEALISQHCAKFIDGTHTSTLALTDPPHIVEEVNSPENLSFLIRVKYISPVRKNSKFFGFIAVHDCESLGSQQ